MDKTNCQRSFSGYVSPTESRLLKKKPKLPPDLARHQHSIIDPQRLGWGHRCAAVALFGAQAEGVRADGAILPDHRHSRDGTGWLLDSSGAAERGNRELRCRCGLDCDVTPPAAGQDR